LSAPFDQDPETRLRRSAWAVRWLSIAAGIVAFGLFVDLAMLIWW